jgi:transporter family protein
MDTGLLLALTAAVVFAVGIVLVRKTSGEVGESFTVAAISIFVGIPLYAIAITVSGDWGKLATTSWKPVIMLCTAGFIHFILGRLAGYSAFRLIGANRATPIAMTCTIYTVILSWIFLDEQLTAFIIVGALCMMSGVLLISQVRGVTAKSIQRASRDEIKGILLSLGAALCWGVTPILIKPSIKEIGSSSLGNFITYGIAGLVMIMLLFGRTRRDNFMRLSLRKNVLPMVIAGIFTSSGQFLYFAALGRSPANIVTPIISTEVLFIYIISFLVNRRDEVFSLKVLLGMVSMVVGTFLLFQ